MSGRYADLRLEWSNWVEQWETSGLSAAEFCRRHDLPVLRFYSWRRRLRISVSDGAAGAFLALSFSDRPKRCGIAVVIGEHLRLELSAGFDQGELLRAVEALGTSSPC